ncbi:MAG: hypothetical protein ACJAZO_000801 [Myxococcota bacterium]|jgi:hypothetical protein
MSYFTRFRPLPLIFGGAITVVLALLLLPKPSTGPAPELIEEPTPQVDVEPEPVPQTHDSPAPAIVPDAQPPQAVQAAPVPSTRPTRDSVLPVSSRGFRDAMELRYDEMVACYDAWADSQEGIEGEQVVRFYIEPGGQQSTLDRVEVMDSSFDNSPMEECVHGVLADTVFEPSDALTIYTFPFSFEGRVDK